MSVLSIKEGSIIENLSITSTAQSRTITFALSQDAVTSNNKTFSITNPNYTYTINSNENIWYSFVGDGTREYIQNKNGTSVFFFSNVPAEFTVTRSDGVEYSIKLDAFTYEQDGNFAYSGSANGSIFIQRGTRTYEPFTYFWNRTYSSMGATVEQKDIIGALAIWSLYGYTPPDPYDAGSNGETTGGGGGINSPDLGGEFVGVPDLPAVSVTDSGFVSLYTGSEGQIKALADYLWTDLLNVQEVVEALKRLVADPMKLIIGMSIVPSQGLNVGASVPVKVGFFDTGLNLTRLASQFFTVDCGIIKFNTVCGNTFLDYSPYAKFSIYLPFIGTRSVDANDFVNHTIGVKYHCDALTGNCTCYVTKDGSVMYQFSGSLSVNCPLSSQDFTSTIISAVQMAAAGVGIVASGGTATAGLLASASAGASQIANNPSVLSPNVAHSGAVSGCAGLLGVLKPYVIREAPTYQSTKNFNTETGYPSNIYIQLGECSGYTQIQDVHLTGINCTDNELNEIEQLLKAGVIF